MKIPKYYEDISITDINTEPMRSYYIPFSPKMELNWSDRNQTDRFLSLNGTWRFKYYTNIYQCKENFYELGFEPSSFDIISVPSNWQMIGYDQIQYTNTQYPFPFDPPYMPHDNPCGAYLKEFFYHFPEKDSEIFLNFEGVDSCCYVWLNGEFVGYHQISHITAEYNVTRYLKEGNNTLAVLVMKWCDGSYLEDQDKFRTSGIFRDVYLLTRPKQYVEDYHVITELDHEFRNATLKVDLKFKEKELKVLARLFDDQGNLIGEEQSDGNRILFNLENVKLWNAESPTLYTLYLITEDEIIREKIGFRQIEVKDAVVYLNGQKIRFRGVNRHDSDPIVGSAVRVDHIIKDLRLMKQHNFNAIRTSHYPNAPEFYQLCDEYGFYVIDEADIEIHGVVELFDLNIFEDPQEHTYPTFICDNPEWIDPILKRVQKMVIRDKNRPCVLVWSMGNEAGYGEPFETALAWTKRNDPYRLTHYEGSLHRPKDRKNDYTNIDFRSRMYASIPEMKAYLSNNPDKPFLLCEYIHAMGNGPGDIEDYYQMEEMYDTYTGGFVWEWADHAIDMGKDENGRTKYHYGGDSGEYPHFGNFCVDGITTPDRKVTEGLLEYKNVHRPARIQSISPSEQKYIIKNNLDFTNLRDFLYLSYDVLQDGVVVLSGEINDLNILNVEPRSQKEVILPITIPDYDGIVSVVIREHLLNRDIFRNQGHELGFNEVIITKQKSQKSRKVIEGILSSTGKIEYSDDEQFIIIRGNQFEYTYNTLTGMFESMIIDNKPLFMKPMELNIWRAPTDNDRLVRKLWYEAGYDMLQTRTYSNHVTTLDDGSLQISVTLSMAPVFRQKVVEFSIVWIVKPDGSLIFDGKAVRNPFYNGEWKKFFHRAPKLYDKHGIEDMHSVNDAYLPRLGIRMFIPKDYDHVTYLGYGPYESYVDKHQASYLGEFHQSVPEMFVDYIRPQENGSHFGCDYVEVKNQTGTITVCSDQTMSFNISEYTSEELTRKNHNFELEKSDCMILCIDHLQSGIGSGSCGPQLAYKYRIDRPEYEFKFYIKSSICHDE